MNKETGQLNSQDCIALANIASQPGYQVQLAIMRREVRNLELEAMDVDPAKTNEVLARQAIAHAAGNFCNLVIKAFDEAVRLAGEKPGLPLTPKEQADSDKATLLDASITPGTRIREVA